MKSDARVKVIANYPIGKLKPEDVVTVPIDWDYVSDYDDVLTQVEAELYEKLGDSRVCIDVTVKILNADELLAELGIH